MKTSTILRLPATGLALLATGCAQKSVTAPPPPAAQAAPAAVAPVVQAPPPAPAAAESNQARLDRMLAEALRPVYFDYDKSEIRPDGEAILREIGRLMKEDASLSITIEGNTDERGSTEYNLALGDRRAAAARRWLSAYGVPASQLKPVSYGKEKPAIAGHDESAWSKNRRDEFVSKPL